MIIEQGYQAIEVLMQEGQASIRITRITETLKQNSRARQDSKE